MRNIFAVVAAIALSLTSVDWCVAENLRQVAVYGGATAADFGGESAAGLAIGVSVGGHRLHRNLFFRYGFEYAEFINSGHISSGSVAGLEPLYEGPGEVALRCLQILAEFELATEIKGIRVAPYVGLGPSLRLEQKVESATPSNGAFRGFSWYKGIDALVVTGVSVGIDRAMVDIQLQQGLRELREDMRELDGGSSSIPFTGGNDRIEAFRIGVGAAF